MLTGGIVNVFGSQFYLYLSYAHINFNLISLSSLNARGFAPFMEIRRTHSSIWWPVGYIAVAWNPLIFLLLDLFWTVVVESECKSVGVVQTHPVSHDLKQKMGSLRLQAANFLLLAEPNFKKCINSSKHLWFPTNINQWQ